MFVKKMKETLNEEFNYSATENGALGYKTSGKELLDINFKVSSLRRKTVEEIAKTFMKAYYEDKLLALKWLFFLRDVRGGLGERRSFRAIIKHLAINEPQAIKNLIGLIPEYGRFDDLWVLLDTSCKDDVLAMIKIQLALDIENANQNKPISLLAKWLPSINASSCETKAMAKVIIKALGYSDRTYRKTLVKLRNYIDIVETKMSQQKWDKIEYSAVPSRANLIYNKAFWKHDEERRREFLTRVEKGEAKINAGTLFPHDIFHKYRDGVSRWGRNAIPNIDATLEELWKALPNTVGESGNTLVVCDSSGSMGSTIGGTNVEAIEVSNALAIYFSERCTGQFKDMYITFSSRPEIVNLSNAKSLREKINIAMGYDDWTNTDLKKVFDLILTTAVKNNMKQSDMPANILMVSDMEFDGATTSTPNQRLFEAIAEQYAQAGYKIPRLIFWNVNSRTDTIPVKENELGVCLCSGFSANIVKMVLTNELDPYKCLLATLNSERYLPIEVAYNK